MVLSNPPTDVTLDVRAKLKGTEITFDGSTLVTLPAAGDIRMIGVKNGFFDELTITGMQYQQFHEKWIASPYFSFSYFLSLIICFWNSQVPFQHITVHNNIERLVRVQLLQYRANVNIFPWVEFERKLTRFWPPDALIETPAKATWLRSGRQISKQTRYGDCLSSCNSYRQFLSESVPKLATMKLLLGFLPFVLVHTFCLSGNDQRDSWNRKERQSWVSGEGCRRSVWQQLNELFGLAVFACESCYFLGGPTTRMFYSRVVCYR